MNRFILNEVAYFGAGSRAAIADEAKRAGYQKAFIVTDKDLVKFGVASKIIEVLEKAEIPYTLFDEVMQNPTVSVVTRGLEAFKAAGAAFIVALGGGSPIDTAKAIGIIANNPEFAEIGRAHV